MEMHRRPSAYMFGCHKGLLNRKSRRVSLEVARQQLGVRTRWFVRVFLGEHHLSFEISTVVHRIGIGDHQSEVPVVDVIFVNLAVISDG